MTVLSDEQIAQLLSMPKEVTKPRQTARVQRKSAAINYPVQSQDGRHAFELYTRQNQIDPEHYSAGLTYQPGGGAKGITLVRYNGSNHTHYNPLEGGARIINQCHIHRATERYMAAGDKGDKCAETTTRPSPSTKRGFSFLPVRRAPHAPTPPPPTGSGSCPLQWRPSPCQHVAQASPAH